MKVHNKIGFHTAAGGNPTGIGDYLHRLDAADIPFFIKAADGMTGLTDAQRIIHSRGGDGPPHVLVYRRSVAAGDSLPPSGNPDVPDYEKEPEAAAAEHWAWHKQHLPPELDPNLVWIETINELRKEVKWADWIGEFAFHTGQRAVNEGHKFAAFGYSTGTPDKGAWETDGMLKYLELCQQHPEQLAVALHEYSLKTDDIWFLRGDHIGRFEKLFAACDKHRVRRPKVLITEWGWTHERVPRDVAKAIDDIKEVGELYARYPDVLGAAIWYLGPGFGGIANRAQKLIEPVTDFTLEHTFEVPDPDEETAPPPPSPRPGVSTARAATGQPNARYLKDVTIPDDTPMPAGRPFSKTWLVENIGNTTWNDSYRLVHTAGAPMSDDTSHSLPPLGPGEQGQVSVPMRAPRTPGAFFSDWRFQDGNGNLFGDIVYARILVEEIVGAMDGPLDSKFVADVTIPDDSRIEPGETFTKTWRVRNSGGRSWDPNHTLEFIGGTNMAEASSLPLPATAPGNKTEISIRMKAPQSPGMYFADWRMKDKNGDPFGEVIYVRIIVPSPAGETLAPPLSQRDSLWANQRLGHAGSPKTIGEWGCLLTCYAMFANSCGHEVTPAQLNHAMVTRGGFIDRYVTKWNALTEVYNSIIYNGKMDQSPQVPRYIDASLNAGNPVSVMVDFTRDTPYTANDQHWVLIVGKDGDDYRINDPWLVPAQEASLRDRYGRSGQPLWKAIRSAVFYRCRDRERRDAPPPGRDGEPDRLERGMNVNPDAPHSNPTDSDVLKGMDWVRFVFKIDARENESERGDINAAFAQYDDIMRDYNRIGVKSLIVLNQETIWGNAPWSGNGNWAGYAAQLAAAARRIAARYKRYGAEVAYEIWNEGDLQNNPASVYAPPEPFATVLQRVTQAIRAESPDSPLVFGGLATGPGESIDYLKACKRALNGPWPVDAIGIHPYGRWATQAPFDWGQQFGTLSQAFDQYRAAIGDMPFWITEMGVAADNEIGPAHYPEIGRYIRDVFQHVEERHTDLVPVVIWFAWSDWMRNAGIVDRNGNRKPHVYPAFRAVRNRELGVM